MEFVIQTHPPLITVKVLNILLVYVMYYHLLMQRQILIKLGIFLVRDKLCFQNIP